MSLASKKRAEAEEHIRLAEKALKTSLLKWQPDHDSAADDFSKAATAFKVAKAYPEALDALERACTCFKECKSLYQAAKMLEQSVLVCKEADRLGNVSQLAERGGLLYRQHGSPESAAQLLEKAAKMLEATHPVEALELYEKAAETIMVEDRPKQASEYYMKVSRLLVKAKLYDRAAETLENTLRLMQESGGTQTAGRAALGLLLVQLVRDDSVAAAKSFHTWGGYCDPDQATAANLILNGFNEEDGDTAKQGMNHHAVKNLDVEFARMAREIRLPQGGGTGETSGLEAAAAAFGAKREQSMVKDVPAPAPLPPASREEAEDTKEEPKKVDEDDEDDLC